MFKILRIVVLLIAATSMGCAYFNTYRRSLNINDGEGVTMDIKQRAILVKKQGTNELKVCAEPSPEALSAYAAQLAAEANIPESVQAKIAASFGEGSSFVGLRTQSIQLLRDTSYRLCEAHMNGAIDKNMYGILLRRYQKYTVALLAIEQLTGTLRVPPTAVFMTGKAEAAKSLSEMTTAMEEIDNKIDNIVTSLNSSSGEAGKLQKEIKKVNGEIEELKKNAESNTDKIAEKEKELKSLNEKKEKKDAEIKKLTEKKKQHEKNKEMIGEAIKNARGLLAQTSTSINISQTGLPHKLSDDQIEDVSEAVSKIVNTIINTDDLGQLCASHFSNTEVPERQQTDGNQSQEGKTVSPLVSSKKDSAFTDVCTKFFDSRFEFEKLYYQLIRTKLKCLESNDQSCLKNTSAIEDNLGKWIKNYSGPGAVKSGIIQTRDR